MTRTELRGWANIRGLNMKELADKVGYTYTTITHSPKYRDKIPSRLYLTIQLLETLEKKGVDWKQKLHKGVLDEHPDKITPQG